MPQSPGLSCRVQVHDDAVHLIAVGELDHQSRDVFDQTVHVVVSGRPSLLVLGLTAVTFLSLEGVAAVVDAGYRAVNGGSTLAIRPGPQAARRLHSVGLTEHTSADADQTGLLTVPQPTRDRSDPLRSPVTAPVPPSPGGGAGGSIVCGLCPSRTGCRVRYRNAPMGHT